MNNTKNSYIVPSIILALGITLAGGLWAYSFYSVKSFENTLSSTGSAKIAVTSDVVKWTLQITRKTVETELKGGYANLAKDIETVKTFLKEKGITDDQIILSQVFVDEVYKYNPSGDTGPKEFNLRQSVTVQSPDVKGVEALSKNIGELVNRDVFVSSNFVEFFVSKLPELRVSLLADAIKDAKARAEQIAQSNGQNVGSLKSAASGVTQVLAPNSIDISDYGQYDTQSLEKEVMVTVRATFFLK